VARIRTIKPEFFTSLAIADLTPERRLSFIGLWTHVDDEGRCVDDARLIKAAIWPLDDRTAEDVESDLRALSESSLITRYTFNRKRYLAVTNWHEHQRISRPTESKLPAPEDGEPTPPTSGNESSVSPHGALIEDSPPERNREQGTGKGTGNVSAKPPRGDVDRLCEHLANRIEANGCKRPAINKRWRDAARLMLDVDQRTEADVHTAIDWCQSDEFWRANILSMAKLRDKYDQLSLQASRSRLNGTVVPFDRRQSGGGDLNVAAHTQLVAQLAAQENNP
jgi:hypothetical protein